MTDKKLKFHSYLAQLSDCPPSNCVEVEMLAYRWVHSTINDDFLPVSIIKEPPPRILNESDLLCMSYGLSLFETLKGAFEKYKRLYSKLRQHQQRQFIEDKGDRIATLQLTFDTGTAGEPAENNFGHFTFYEYDHTDLKGIVNGVSSIFEMNGSFINQTI